MDTSRAHIFSTPKAAGRLAAWIAASILGVMAATAASPAAAQACDRACLYGHLDKYLAALKAHDPKLAPFARNVRYTENNVALRIPDGVWNTIDELGTYDLRFADPKTGGVGFHGTLREGETHSPFALRLKVAGGRITEAETIIVRAEEAAIPFVSAKLEPLPVMNEILAPADRSPREKMIKLADGYFSTLQLNDGKLHTEFHDHCNRREDGFQTTNNPQGAQKYGFSMGLGCAAQFKLGYFRYDDRLRARRYMLVDEERGIVMSAAFIDHEGKLRDFKLTDGRQGRAAYFRPNTLALLETFKIKQGKIEQIEAVFTSVPYRMPSPWVAAGFVLDEK